MILIAPATVAADTETVKAAGAGSLLLPFPSDIFDVSWITECRDTNHDGFTDFIGFSEFNDLSLWIVYGQGDGAYTEAIRIQLVGDDNNQNWHATAAQLDGDCDSEVIFRNGGLAEFVVHEHGGVVTTFSVEGLEYENTSDTDLCAAVIRAGLFDSSGSDTLLFNTTTNQLIIRWPDGSIERVTHPSLTGEFAILPLMDFNSDGKLDVLLYVRDTGAFLFLAGTGNAALAKPVVLDLVHASVGDTERPVFGQLDDNPAIDMMTANAITSEVIFAYNIATPAMSESVIEVDCPVYLIGLPGDLDSSGRDDLVLKRDGLYPLSTTGVILVQDPAPDHFELNSNELRRPSSNSINGNDRVDFDVPYVWGIDLDRDNDEDLLWSGTLYSLDWTENRASNPGIEHIGIDIYTEAPAVTHISMIDLNGDGIDEAIVSGPQNARVVDFASGNWTRIIASSNAFMSMPADLDGDGVPELVVPETVSSGVRVFRLQSDGRYADRAFIPTGLPSTGLGLEVADLNDDGYEDVIVVQQNPDGVLVMLGNPEDMLLPGQFIAIPIGTNMTKAAILNFNQDGIDDIAVAIDALEQTVLYRGLGDGTFEESTSYFSQSNYWLTAADVDGDGFTDIVGCAGNKIGGTYIEINYLGINGELMYQDSIFASTVAETVMCDINNDGLLDIAAATTTSTTYNNLAPMVFVQTEPRVFSTRIQLPAPVSPAIVSSDINQDGIPDLITGSNDFDQLRIHYGSSISDQACSADLNGDGELNFFDVSLFVQTLPDYNGDGSFNFFDVSAFLVDYQAGCP